MKKIFAVSLIIIIIAVLSLAFAFYYTPSIGTYDAQKKYAENKYKHAGNATDSIFYLAPNEFIGELSKKLFERPAWFKSLKAHSYLLKKYPTETSQDVDVWGRLGDTYFYLKDYDNAIKCYEKELNIFKARYFGKDYTEKAGLSAKRAKLEEYRFIIRSRYDIARCYNAKKEYKKSLEEYDNILSLLPDLKEIDTLDKYDLFKETFQSRGKLFKVIFKDYKQAIDNYEKMALEFPHPLMESRAMIFIGDTYLAKGDIGKAKEIYNKVISDFKGSAKITESAVAERRLKDLEKGKIIAVDSVVYEIKDGKVKVIY